MAMFHKNNTYRPALIISLLVGLSACAPARLDFKQLAPLPTDTVCRVMVLPFADNSGYPRGGMIFSRIFAADLIEAGNYLVPSEGDIKEVFRLLKIYPRQELNSEQIRLLAERLDVRLVITGTLLELDETGVGRDKKLGLGVLVGIYDGRTGARLWTTYNRRDGDDYRKIMHFGVINNITQLAHMVSKEIIKTWFDRGLTRCTD
ncbi:MAG: hypothetical protein L3J03_10560 [Desulfobacterales bacterium]|nr:hypothetical protein [Desulfobacterales bacterium]